MLNYYHLHSVDLIEYIYFSPMLRRDHCLSDDDLLEVTEHRPVYDSKNPAEV